MKCQKCMKEHNDNIIVKIVDKHKTYQYCPNCLLDEELNNNLNLKDDSDIKCEITGKPACIYISGDEKYVLNSDIMHRLIRCNLEPEEYLTLIKTRQGKFSFMIHEDFYDEDGYALQPIN